jgi:hypothetical protein
MDDRRYMTWEERAVDDARYRPGGKYGGKVSGKDATITCHCGKTVYSHNGIKVSDHCPRDCEAHTHSH